MKKDKGSLAFWLTVCVLVVCVALAKDSSHTSKAMSSTDVVYPDYYAKAENTADTADKEDIHTDDKAAMKAEQEENVTISEPVVPLADTIVEEPSKSQTASTAVKKAVQNTASAASVPVSTSLIERKSRLLSDMAQSSVVADSAQTLANALIAAKTARYQTLATGTAVAAATLHNQRREAVLDLIENRQKTHAATANRIITQTGETTKDVLDTTLTIHNDIQQNIDKIHDDLQQNADHIESDVKDTIDQIHNKHEEIKDFLDKLNPLPDLPWQNS